jgi:hypothetical protein
VPGVGTSLAGFATGAVVSGLWLVGDGFRFGVSAAAKEGSARQKGAEVATAALAAAGLSPAQARFAVFHATPGDEEGLLDGAFGSLNRQTALVGGSAADDDLSGKWKVWSHEGAFGAGVALAVCDWPGKIGVSYQAGYLPSDKRGKVTAAQGRTLLSIDGRPAAEVYDEWTGGRIAAELAAGGNVLGKTTLAPLGLPRGMFGGFEAFVLVHPERVEVPARSLSLFADVEVGQQVVLMESSQEALVHRGANVARTALTRSGLAPTRSPGRWWSSAAAACSPSATACPSPWRRSPRRCRRCPTWRSTPSASRAACCPSRSRTATSWPARCCSGRSPRRATVEALDAATGRRAGERGGEGGRQSTVDTRQPGFAGTPRRRQAPCRASAPAAAP